MVAGLVDRTSPSEAKIALFRSLFRGREDVYPRRFESRKTGRAGYAPACANEWVRGICEKPRSKCADCPNRRFLPVTDDVIRWHLSGQGLDGEPFVAGIYPLLQEGPHPAKNSRARGSATPIRAARLRRLGQRYREFGRIISLHARTHE